TPIEANAILNAGDTPGRASAASLGTEAVINRAFPSRFKRGLALLLGRYHGAACDRQRGDCRGLGWLGRQLGRLWRGGRTPGRIAQPAGKLFSASGAVLGIGRPLVLAVGRIGGALDADVEVIIVSIIGADLGEP